MKMIIMNKRKLEVLAILVILMGLLFGVGEMIKGELKSVSFMQNNIKKLKTIEALDGKVTYKLPSEWTTSMTSFPGNQIVYHNDFTANDFLVSGFVQVWNNVEDLKSFLEMSKKVSEKQNEIKDYSMNNLKMDSHEGYLVKYIMNSKGTDYMAYEYFIKYKNGFIRFSFFSRNQNFKENMKTLYESIVKTVQIKEV